MYNIKLSKEDLEILLELLCNANMSNDESTEKVWCLWGKLLMLLEGELVETRNVIRK